MGRFKGRRLAALVVAVVAGAQGGCAVANDGPPAAWTCTPRALEVSAEVPLTGVEDLAYDPLEGRLILSSLNHHARRTPQGWTGGLYSLPVEALGGTDPLRPQRLWPEGGATDQVLPAPHGIALDEEGGRLAVIDHQLVGGRGSWADASRLVVLARASGGGWAEESVIEGRHFLKANDVIPDPLRPGGWLVSQDRGSQTGLGRALETALTLARGKVVRADTGETVADGITFANGLIVRPGGLGGDRTLYVSETRNGGLAAFDLGGRPVDAVPLPGGPDNLAAMADGRILAAVLPSPFLIGMELLGVPFLKAPGARIIAIDPMAAPGAGRLETILNDPERKVLRGATGVVQVAPDLIVVSSVLESRLAVCRPAPGA